MTRRKQQEYDRARALRQEGQTIRAIAREIGVHNSTVQEWVRDIPTQHRLSSIDEVTRTAECSLCGRVSLRKNGSKKWRCRNVVRENQERTIAAGQSRFYEYLAQQQCIDCGESDLIVLEFDHVQDDKSYNISDMVQKGYKWESVMKEIAKCEVVCANCHRRRTNIRGDWFRHAAR